MAVTAYWYGKAFEHAFNKLIDFDTDTIKVSLHTSTYTPDQDADDYWDDCDNEVSGTGYTHEGATLANASITYTAGTNVLKLDGDDVTWSSSEITARYAVVYVRETEDNASPLICYIDFGEDKSSDGGDFTITWHEDGICKVTVS